MVAGNGDTGRAARVRALVLACALALTLAAGIVAVCASCTQGQDTPIATNTVVVFEDDAPEDSDESPSADSQDAPGASVSQKPGDATATDASPAEAPKDPATAIDSPGAPATISASVTVDASRAASSGFDVSFGPATIELEKGATAFDALLATGLPVNASAGYVRGIAGLSEFSCGSQSGWMYAVNGSFPRTAANGYVLHDGDAVRWIYTLELGRDL